MLLALVIGVVLVLLGVTASALVAVTSTHLSNGDAEHRCQPRRVAHRALRQRHAQPERPGDRRTRIGAPRRPQRPARHADRQRLGLRTDHADSILRVELRALDGRVIASDDPAAVGLDGAASAAMAAALSGSRRRRRAHRGRTAARGRGRAAERRRAWCRSSCRSSTAHGEPARGCRPLARRADACCASLEATRRDIMLVTLFAALIARGDPLPRLPRGRRRGSRGSTASSSTRRGPTL